MSTIMSRPSYPAIYPARGRSLPRLHLHPRFSIFPFPNPAIGTSRYSAAFFKAFILGCILLAGFSASVFPQEEGLSAPDSTRLVLPDVIVDLPEPDYGDVQTLLPGARDEENLFRALPRPRELGGPELPPEGAESEQMAGEGAATSAPAVQFTLGGGYAPGMYASFQVFDPLGSYLLAGEHLQSWGDFAGTYTPPADGFAASRSGILGRYDPGFLQAEYHIQGLGALEFHEAQQLLDLEAGFEWNVAGFSGELNLLQDYRRMLPAVQTGTGIPDGYFRFAGESSNRYRKEWERIALELPLSYRIELSPQYGLWQDFSLGGVLRSMNGEPWNYEIGYLPGISRGPGAGVSREGTAPGYTSPGYRGINHNFHLGLGFNGERWGHKFRAGFQQLRPDETSLWKANPLLSPYYLIPDGTAESEEDENAVIRVISGAPANRPMSRKWFVSADSEMALTEDLLLSGALDASYYYERPIAGPWDQSIRFQDDGRDFRDWYASSGWNFVTSLGFRGLFTENIFAEAFWLGNFLLDDGLRPSQQLEAQVELQGPNETLSAAMHMELNLFRNLQPPLFRISGSWKLSQLWALNLEISDPVAAFLSRGRYLSDPYVSPVRTRGFTVELFVEFEKGK